MSPQLVLPLPPQQAFGRADFIVAPCNAQAVAFIDSWPSWSVGAAAIYGPSGAGKSHLVSAWRFASGARVVSAAKLAHDPVDTRPCAIEDVDSQTPSEARDAELFRLIEGASPEAPVLLTGLEAPATWPSLLPDLASRFSALPSFALWKPDDELLAALARKLLADRQLTVPAAVINRVVQSLERAPGAIRDFIAKADAKALSESRPITLSLVREALAEEDSGLA